MLALPVRAAVAVLKPPQRVSEAQRRPLENARATLYPARHHGLHRVVCMNIGSSFVLRAGALRLRARGLVIGRLPARAPPAYLVLAPTPDGVVYAADDGPGIRWALLDTSGASKGVRPLAHDPGKPRRGF